MVFTIRKSMLVPKGTAVNPIMVGEYTKMNDPPKFASIYSDKDCVFEYDDLHSRYGGGSRDDGLTFKNSNNEMCMRFCLPMDTIFRGQLAPISKSVTPNLWNAEISHIDVEIRHLVNI